jgi:hypothetical protein
MLALLLMGLLISALDVKEVLAQSPVPVISGPALSNQATIDVTIDFDDSSRAILASEIGNPAKVEIVGGTAGGKVSQNSPQDTVWLVTITRSGGNSDVNVTVHSGWYQDEAENWNLDASKVFIYDDSAPDIGITNLDISKTVVGLGYSLNINVTIANQGDYTETSNATAYANTTIIASQNVTLTAGNSTTVTFTWNTTGFAYGNYTLSAYALPVPGETDTTDNNYTSSIPVHVGVPGDISGPTQGVYDGTTNMRDVQYLILLFNTNPSSPNWKPNADINNDGTVNMRDIQIAILNFNKHE